MTTKEVANKAVAKKKAKTKNQIVAERRKIRDDLGSTRDVMRVPKLPGFVFRWVNDDSRGGISRVKSFEQRGWRVYDGDAPEVGAPNTATEYNISEGAGGKITVGQDPRGKPLQAVLMYISEEIAEIDRELKDEARRNTMSELQQQTQAEGHYGNIKVGNI